LGSVVTNEQTSLPEGWHEVEDREGREDKYNPEAVRLFAPEAGDPVALRVREADPNTADQRDREHMVEGVLDAEASDGRRSIVDSERVEGHEEALNLARRAMEAYEGTADDPGDDLDRALRSVRE
jgi:hypothetical protein